MKIRKMAEGHYVLYEIEIVLGSRKFFVIEVNEKGINVPATGSVSVADVNVLCDAMKVATDLLNGYVQIES